MGGGGYSFAASRARVETRAFLPKQTVFPSRSCHPSMDPKGIALRESCDSAEHPDSVAVAFLVDVTRSMDDIPHDLATRTLPHFAEMVLPFLPDLQVLLGAVGDAQEGDRAPLQIGQWESDDGLIDQWLTRLHLEAGGGPNGEESYDLALFFAARLAKVDCALKRGRQGYLFLTGDERPRDRVNASVVNRVFGRQLLDRDLPLEAVVAEASELFHIFFLIPDLRRAEECEQVWRRYLGDQVIAMEDPQDTALVAATLIGLTEGKVPGELRAFKEWIQGGHGVDGKVATRIYRAVRSYAATLPDYEERRPVNALGITMTRRASGNVRLHA